MIAPAPFSRCHQTVVRGRTQGRRRAVATFVLVQCAVGGGGCCRWVAPELRAAGLDVYTPTLTGFSERVHLASPQVDLDTH